MWHLPVVPVNWCLPCSYSRCYCWRTWRSKLWWFTWRGSGSGIWMPGHALTLHRGCCWPWWVSLGHWGDWTASWTSGSGRQRFYQSDRWTHRPHRIRQQIKHVKPLDAWVQVFRGLSDVGNLCDSVTSFPIEWPMYSMNLYSYSPTSLAAPGSSTP